MQTDSIVPVIVAVMFVWAIVAGIEDAPFMRLEGSVKRGIEIGSGPLSFEQEKFFRDLPDGILDKPSGAFIKKADNAVLVQHLGAQEVAKMWPRKRTPFPCVAYIDLNSSQPRIEYRIPIWPIPFLAMWLTLFLGMILGGLVSTRSLWPLALLVPLALVAWIVYEDNAIQRERILALISEKMQAYLAERAPATGVRPIRKFW